jgi:1,4-dihydroxy-6-naphthoate synthase
MRIRIGLSSGPAGAFMLEALVAGRVAAPGLEIEPVREDIESLNRRARAAELEVTAISAATYALVAERYRLTEAGVVMGTGHGPILVAREAIDPREIPERVVAIPGSHTTASLLLRLYCGDPPLIEVASDRIGQAVREGQADLGLLICEGPATYEGMGLVKVLDLGEAWRRDTGLPLPLAVNVVRRDLDEETQRRLAQALHDSIAWPRLGDEGRAALIRLFAEAHRRGLIEAAPLLDPIALTLFPPVA